MTGALKEIADPGSTYRARDAADDAKCQQYGFKPATEAYGNCRLQLDQIRATKQAAASKSHEPNEKKGLSLLCKDSISRGDEGGTFVHC